MNRIIVKKKKKRNTDKKKHTKNSTEHLYLPTHSCYTLSVSLSLALFSSAIQTMLRLTPKYIHTQKKTDGDEEKRREKKISTQELHKSQSKSIICG